MGFQREKLGGGGEKAWLGGVKWISGGLKDH